MIDRINPPGLIDPGQFGYAQIAKLTVLYEEFEKTPTKKIKRRLYNAFS